MNASYALPEGDLLKHQLDIRIPIQTVRSRANNRTASEQANHALLSERYYQCRKTVIRLQIQVYGRKGASRLRYIALSGEDVMLACPTPSQAKAAIRMIQDVIMSLNGKLLDESILNEVK